MVLSCNCRIADGPVRVELLRTLHTNVPGVAFGVSAEAFSNEDDTPVKGEVAGVHVCQDSAAKHMFLYAGGQGGFL